MTTKKGSPPKLREKVERFLQTPAKGYRTTTRVLRTIDISAATRFAVRKQRLKETSAKQRFNDLSPHLDA